MRLVVALALLIVGPIDQQAHQVRTQMFHDLPLGTHDLGLTFDGKDQSGQRLPPANYSVQFLLRVQPTCQHLTDTGAGGGWIQVR